MCDDNDPFPFHNLSKNEFEIVKTEGTYLPSQGIELGIKLGFEFGIGLHVEFKFAIYDCLKKPLKDATFQQANLFARRARNKFPFVE
jgi:hypothetical protein